MSWYIYSECGKEVIYGIAPEIESNPTGDLPTIDSGSQCVPKYWKMYTGTSWYCPDIVQD